MIKLIKEFLQSGIEANNAITKAMNTSVKSHTKSIEYLDNLINHDLMRQEREIAILDKQLKGE